MEPMNNKPHETPNTTDCGERWGNEMKNLSFSTIMDTCFVYQFVPKGMFLPYCFIFAQEGWRLSFFALETTGGMGLGASLTTKQLIRYTSVRSSAISAQMAGRIGETLPASSPGEGAKGAARPHVGRTQGKPPQKYGPLRSKAFTKILQGGKSKLANAARKYRRLDFFTPLFFPFGQG
jgi:hypothetical protein